MRVVIDTNLLVSALLSPSGSTPRKLLVAVRAGRLQPVLSQPLIDEFRDVITRPKFAKYQLTNGDILEVLTALLAAGSFVEITGRARGCSDPGDDAVIETAEVGDARFIITGDRRDLLNESMRESLASRGIEVVTAADFLGEAALNQATMIGANYVHGSQPAKRAKSKKWTPRTPFRLSSKNTKPQMTDPASYRPGLLRVHAM